jgi:hypothetical protein
MSRVRVGLVLVHQEIFGTRSKVWSRDSGNAGRDSGNVGCDSGNVGRDSGNVGRDSGNVGRVWNDAPVPFLSFAPWNVVEDSTCSSGVAMEMVSWRAVDEAAVAPWMPDI